MRDVAVIATSFLHEESAARDEVELIHAVVSDALSQVPKAADRIGFVCSGSADLLIGRPFSFVQGLDGIGAWPPVSESHVEMDGAWAFLEAWTRLQLGDIDAALVYCFARPSAGTFSDVSVLQMDPYVMAPLWPDADTLADLQADAMAAAQGRENAENTGSSAHKVVDGAAALVLAAGSVAENAEKRAWIAGLDHRVEAHALGARELGRSVSTKVAAQHAWVQTRPIATGYVTASHSHALELVGGALKEAGLNDGAQLSATDFTPMVTGLSNICRAANDVMEKRAIASLAHASSGACLQHNLVCVLESNHKMGLAQ